MIYLCHDFHFLAVKPNPTLQPCSLSLTWLTYIAWAVSRPDRNSCQPIKHKLSKPDQGRGVPNIITMSSQVRSIEKPCRGPYAVYRIDNLERLKKKARKS